MTVPARPPSPKKERRTAAVALGLAVAFLIGDSKAADEFGRESPAARAIPQTRSLAFAADRQRKPPRESGSIPNQESDPGNQDAAPAADWPHWQGPNRNGHTDEPSLFDGGRWLAPKPVWEAQVGEGGTSPIVAGGRLYTLGWSDEKDTVVCLEAATGKPIWKQSYPAPQYGRFAEGDKGVYSGPSSTPELDLDAGLLYTLGCDGELRSWRIADGSLVWRKNLYDEYGVTQRPELKDKPRERRIGRTGLRDYGYTTAPLATGGRVLVEVGAPDALVFAFDGKTGDEVWKSERGGFAGHTGGLVPTETPHGPAVAVLALREFALIETGPGREGKTAGLFPWESGFANNVQTPAVDGSSAFVTSYHTHRAIRRLDLAAGDDGTLPEVWKAEYSSRVGSPVVDGKFVYLAGPELYCLDRESGRLAWKGGAFAEGASCVACGDGRLVLLGSQGDVIVAEGGGRSTDRYVELAKVHLEGAEWWPHVVVSGGRVYAKDRAGRLVCLGRPSDEVRPRETASRGGE